MIIDEDCSTLTICKSYHRCANSTNFGHKAVHCQTFYSFPWENSFLMFQAANLFVENKRMPEILYKNSFIRHMNKTLINLLMFYPRKGIEWISSFALLVQTIMQRTKIIPHLSSFLTIISIFLFGYARRGSPSIGLKYGGICKKMFIVGVWTSLQGNTDSFSIANIRSRNAPKYALLVKIGKRNKNNICTTEQVKITNMHTFEIAFAEEKRRDCSRAIFSRRITSTS